MKRQHCERKNVFLEKWKGTSCADFFCRIERWFSGTATNFYPMIRVASVYERQAKQKWYKLSEGYHHIYCHVGCMEGNCDKLFSWKWKAQKTLSRKVWTHFRKIVKTSPLKLFANVKAFVKDWSWDDLTVVKDGLCSGKRRDAVKGIARSAITLQLLPSVRGASISVKNRRSRRSVMNLSGFVRACYAKQFLENENRGRLRKESRQSTLKRWNMAH